MEIPEELRGVWAGSPRALCLTRATCVCRGAPPPALQVPAGELTSGLFSPLQPKASAPGAAWGRHTAATWLQAVLACLEAQLTPDSGLPARRGVMGCPAQLRPLTLGSVEPAFSPVFHPPHSTRGRKPAAPADAEVRLPPPAPHL